MAEFEDAFFRKHIGQSRTEFNKRATLADALKLEQKKILSNFPVLTLGQSSEGTFILTEEERNHIHIVGVPGQGKSKLLELFIRHDIDRLVREKHAPGLALIDSSDFGNTFLKVLRYCRKVGFTKVCIIDPNDLSGDIGKVCTLNVFGQLQEYEGRQRYARPPAAAAASVKNIFRVLWEDQGFAQIANLNRSLELLSNVLHRANATLYDAQYFRVKTHPLYKMKREAIIARSPAYNESRIEIEELFHHSQPNIFDQRFGSTIGRLAPAFVGNLKIMLASNACAVNLQKLIGDGWIVLCNLDPAGWDVPQRRLLGTLIISEVIEAVTGLVRAGRQVPFRLYVDEVGRYATEMLAELLHYKRTSQIQLIAAHQQFSQLKNKEVASALATSPIKVSFYAEREDRDYMFKRMYYGDMDRRASDAFSALEKQHIVIKVGKDEPRKVRLRDLPDIPADKEADKAFRAALYEHPWYRTRQEINDEINARIPITQGEPAPTLKKSKRAKPKGAMGDANEKRIAGENSGDAPAGAVPDHQPGGSSVLRRKAGRATRKINPGEA